MTEQKLTAHKVTARHGYKWEIRYGTAEEYRSIGHVWQVIGAGGYPTGGWGYTRDDGRENWRAGRSLKAAAFKMAKTYGITV